MEKLQFRLLYREFLFRMVDLELLSVQGDMSRLLGQFAALLLFFSAVQSLGAMLQDNHMPREAFLISVWGMEHSLIAMTMLVVGLFAVLSWDSTFPDRRDVLVLAPLPVRARTLFLAKLAASGAALGLTVVALNALTGLAWPMILSPTKGGLLYLLFSLGSFRAFGAYWITMFSAGAFIYGSVLGVQGFAAQLPRRWFLRLSALLQMAAFCLFVTVYLLQPSIANPQGLLAPANQRALEWLPSYWFLGLFQQLNGSMHPAMVPLAQRAWIALAIVTLLAGTVFLLAYFRTLRKIVEEPDIVPGATARHWQVRFGTPLQTAVTLFSVRTLLRSRQHRMILAFFVGLGFAAVILLGRTVLAPRKLPANSADGSISVPLLVASILMMCLLLVGLRVVFSLPLQLRANWMFRVTPIGGGPHCVSANRRLLLVVGVLPVWVVSAACYFSIWPWRAAAGHLMILALLGIIVAEFCLHGFQKIPFTCSYLPGKSYVHMVVMSSLWLIFLVNRGAEFERTALRDGRLYLLILGGMTAVALFARWRTGELADESDSALHFEEEPEKALISLEINSRPATTR